MLLFLSCFLTGFFVFAENIIAETNHLLITEVQISDQDSSSHDFIEIYNPTNSTINLNNYRLIKRTATSNSDSSIKSWGPADSINPEEYKIWAFSSKDDDFASTLKADFWTGSIVSPKNGIAIRSGAIDTGVIIDSVGWGADCKNIFCNNPFITVIDDAHTINRKMKSGKFVDTDNDADDFILGLPSPKENTIEIPEEKPKIYSNNIALNEILPYPPKGQDEFIELYNPAENDVKLADWILRDGSKNGEYIFPDGTSIESQGYLLIYKEKFKFALNNSGTESVTLSSPDEKIVSEVSYTGAKENISYNFNGQTWRWSKFLTPNAENIFNNLPQVKDDVPKKAYQNMYADFSAKGKDADKDKLKYTWDFDDGHKSYLRETRHKYAKTGKYNIILKISDGSEDTIRTFKIAVKKFPKLDVKIVGLSPNPKGKDTDAEFIIVKNNSPKKINLKDWSVASGTKKTINHPIAQDSFIAPGKSAKITHLLSKFTLPNTAAKIELRYPTGKVASKLAYKSPAKSVAEDATYEKTKLGWVWKNQTPPSTVPAADTTLLATAQPTQEITPPQKNLEQLSQELETKENLGKFSPSPEFETKKKTKFSLLNFGLRIKTVSAFSNEESIPTKNYFSTSEFPARKHWLIKLVDDISSKLNLSINKFFTPNPAL